MTLSDWKMRRKKWINEQNVKIKEKSNEKKILRVMLHNDGENIGWPRNIMIYEKELWYI